MKSHDPLEQWASDRARETASDGFADRVMAAVRDPRMVHEGDRASTEVMARWSSPRRAIRVALAACAALSCHAAVVGTIWWAWPHLAQ